jgi:hypothetical protein
VASISIFFTIVFHGTHANQSTGHYTWWRISGHVAACSGDGARDNGKSCPVWGFFHSCRQLCALHHGSVPDTLSGTHLLKPTFVKDLAGNIPA